MVDQREDLLRIVTSSTSFAPADILTEGSFPLTLVRALLSIPIISLVAWQLFFFLIKYSKHDKTFVFLPSSCFFLLKYNFGSVMLPPHTQISSDDPNSRSQLLLEAFERAGVRVQS